MNGEVTGTASSKRILAAGLDATVALLVSLAAGRVLGVGRPWLGWVSAAVVYTSYFAVLEGVFGQTLWKAVLGLRVVSVSGGRASDRSAWVRSVFRLLEANPLVGGLFPGGIFVAFSRKRQRLGDLAARTVVVDLRRPEEAVTLVPFPNTLF